MKTIATMALLIGTIAVGIAPAAEARDARSGRDGRAHHDEIRHDSDKARGFAPGAHTLHARQVHEIRNLAVALERATDELHRDARRSAGALDRGEAHAIRALYHLEEAADRFSRSSQRRGPVVARELRQDLQAVKVAFRHARADSDALRMASGLRRDFRRVDRLIEALDDAFTPNRRVAWWDHRQHVAGR